MKKVIRFGIFCFIASILFTSCKSSMSVTKRRYNSGYYITYNNGKQCSPALKEQTKTTSSASTNQVKLLQEQVKQKKTKEYAQDNCVEDNTTVVASTEKKQYRTVLKQHIKQIQALQTKIIENRTLQIKQTLSKTKKTNTTSSDDDDALSLFWIVILVILILWALGLLAGGFGLGGLINLLLLVALILLILWLLKIV